MSINKSVKNICIDTELELPVDSAHPSFPSQTGARTCTWYVAKQLNVGSLPPVGGHWGLFMHQLPTAIGWELRGAGRGPAIPALPGAGVELTPVVRKALRQTGTEPGRWVSACTERPRVRAGPGDAITGRAVPSALCSGPQH